MKQFEFSRSMKAAGIWVGGGLVGIVVLAAALFNLLKYFDAQQDIAAWVQAIGSVAAVLVAAWVASNQSAMALQLRRDMDSEALKKIVAIAKYAGKVSENLQIYVSLGDSERPHLERFFTSLQDCVFLLRSVDYMQIPIAEAALGWIELRHALQDEVAWLEKWLASPEFQGNEDDEPLGEANIRAARAVVRVLNSASGLMPELLATEEP
ncbi:hypothetical protein [Pseudomonas sp. EggHat1]|uniref:hypothetical protein n=1 Tax=Pseudomonas sp. EggHat1 TaxID=2761624 RepID=UPI001868D79D|nr:hypothetical protein [Pseudomonas sp. EggHat1]